MVSSAALFKLVEAILKPLCQTKGWHLDTQKPSCVRIELSNIEHVDIALYAISDDEFSKLVEKAALAQVGDVATTRQRIQDSMALDDLLYASLSEEGIALAHRKQGWKRSDPRKLDEWFHECMRTFGEPFRRISRYLKGWRDFAFVESRLASIALMAAVEAAFLRGAELNPQRDDRTLHAVASTLSETLSKPIPNPVVSGARLDEGWDEAERKQYIEAAKELARLLQFALYDAKSQSDVIDVLRSAFGRRVPNDQSLVTLEEFELETKSAVLAMPAIAKPASEERMTRLDAAFAKSENSGYRARPWAGRHK